MPLSGPSADFDGDDFEEYNPHPYLGGYDIARTYGHPLPPSSATCYPISSSASPPSYQTTPRPPHATSPTFDHGLPENYQPEPFPSPDLFRSWPYSTWEDRQVYHGDAEAGGGWNGWRRALDYLFGHAQGYGERRVGVDSYGIPIYANKKLGGAESVAVEVEPAPVQRLVEYYHPHSGASCCGEATEETHGYENPVLAYNEHHFNQQAAYQDRVHHTSAFDGRDHVTALFGGPGVADDRHHHHHGRPLHLQAEPIETAWSRRSSCSEVYEESTCSKSDWNSMLFGDEGNKSTASEAPSHHSIQSQYHESRLEPYKATWSQWPSYYEEAHDEHASSDWHLDPFPDFSEWDA